ncbi:hypothetical protein GNT69_18340 [Bacillus sp. B15-48]|nr:hypothetical protein [Bacillus sp. B15-48]
MEMYEILLWVVFPYTVLAIVGMGLIWHRQNSCGSKGQRLLTGVINSLFILSTVSGLAMIYFSNEYAQFFLWLISLIKLNPDMSLITTISVLPKVHFLITLFFLLGLAFSNKIVYVLKPHLFIKNFIIRYQVAKRHL